jgi:hypothetical protein
MFDRILHALPGSLGLAGLAFLAVGYYAGPVAGAAAALVGGLIGVGLTRNAAAPSDALQRHLNACSVLLGVHAASLYTFGSISDTTLLPVSLQAAIAVVGAAICAICAARIPPPQPADKRNEDPDATLEIGATASHTVIVETQRTPPLRGALIAAIALSAMLVLSALYWLGDIVPGDSVSTAAATERPADSPTLLQEPPAAAEPELPPAAESIVEPAPEIPIVEPAQSALALSAARRECMAQLETARLFLQIAREAPDPADYTLATEAQMERILKERPVGPRTLARIAERMWERRGEPEREPNWWATQYARCEAARSSGTWYVVRG